MAALRPQNLLFLHPFALLADRALAGTSTRRLDRRRSQTRLDAAARSGMLRPRTAGTRRRHARTDARFGHHRLSGTNGSAINRLSGNRSAGRLWNSGTRLHRLLRHHRARRTEFGHQIGTRRHHRARCGLAGQRALLLRGHRHRGRSRTSGARRLRFRARMRRRTRDHLRPLLRSSRSGRRGERLSRSGEHLAGPWRGGQRLGGRHARTAGGKHGCRRSLGSGRGGRHGRRDCYGRRRSRRLGMDNRRRGRRRRGARSFGPGRRMAAYRGVNRAACERGPDRCHGTRRLFGGWCLFFRGRRAFGDGRLGR